MGKLVLMTRFGRKNIKKLDNLIEWVKDKNFNVIWICDPMHGNTYEKQGYKTRCIRDIQYEIDKFLFYHHRKNRKKIDGRSKTALFQSVGIGTSFTNMTVGFAGVTPIKRSVPPKAIFLPNHKFKSGDELSLVSYETLRTERKLISKIFYR